MNDDRYCRRRRMTKSYDRGEAALASRRRRLIRSCSLGRILSSAWLFIYLIVMSL